MRRERRVVQRIELGAKVYSLGILLSLLEQTEQTGSEWSSALPMVTQQVWWSQLLVPFTELQLTLW